MFGVVDLLESLGFGGTVIVAAAIFLFAWYLRRATVAIGAISFYMGLVAMIGFVLAAMVVLGWFDPDYSRITSDIGTIVDVFRWIGSRLTALLP